jgi:hypothetical protein
MMVPGVIGPIPGGSTSQAGFGDVMAQDEVFFVQGTARRPWVSSVLRVKFPTADKTQGLTSGAYDYGAGVGLIQPVGRAWYVLGTFQYVMRGDPPGIDFSNTPGSPSARSGASGARPPGTSRTTGGVR